MRKQIEVLNHLQIMITTSFQTMASKLTLSQSIHSSLNLIYLGLYMMHMKIPSELTDALLLLKLNKSKLQ